MPDKNNGPKKKRANWKKIYIAVFLTGIFYILAMAVFTMIYNKP